MNLNTLVRQGVIGPDAGTENDRLRGRSADRRGGDPPFAGQYPYQFLAAYTNASDEVPQKIKAALHKAAEIACGNVPELPGPVVIGLDVSGSMASPVTGRRGRGATSKMRCVDVAACLPLPSCGVTPDSIVIPFDDKAYDVRVDPGDTILGLAARPGGLRWWRHQLRAAAGRGQREVRQPQAGWLRAGQRQPKLDRRWPSGLEPL